jgi:ribosomal protein S18 acetylase RimI-like enzyme
MADILLAMAACVNSAKQTAGNSGIVDLRRITADDLASLLSDEVLEWRRELDWDLEPSAELVRRYVTTGSLGGVALMADGEVAGYGYAVLDEPRAIVGDIYVRQRCRNAETEAQLFQAVSEALAATPRISRMESQLMLVPKASAAIIGNLSPGGHPVRLFERLLMSRNRSEKVALGNPDVRNRFRLERWEDHFLHGAATIIASSYEGTTDSEISSQYRSPAGARRFLSSIVEFPGCGNFHRAASFVAFDRKTGETAGMVLSSFVAGDSGHVSQICVLPQSRGAGLGKELLRNAATAMYADGARTVSLTVTASNKTAIALYSGFGFHTVREFFAYVWQA